MQPPTKVDQMQSLSPTKPIFPWSDQLRVLASIAVVFIHASAEVVVEANPNSIDWHMGNLYDAISRWGVPAFVLVSGALLLDPSKDESPDVFFRKRINRILWPIIFWSVVYFIYRAFWGSGLDLRLAIRSLMIGRPFAHLWYIYMIPGLYLLVPSLRTYIRSSNPLERHVITISLLTLFSLSSVAQVIYYQIPQTELVFTAFVPYVAYFLCGYQLRLLDLDKIETWWLMIAIGGLSVSMIVGTELLTSQLGLIRGLLLYDYLSPPVVIISVAVFILILKLNASNFAGIAFFQRISRTLAPATLGIYLIHPLIIEIFRHNGFSTQTKPAISIPIVTFLAFVLSYISVIALGKIPILKKTVV